MDRDRSTILALVAAGRISAGEAERLLAAWNESRETGWILMLCAAMAVLAQVHPGEFVAAYLHFIHGQVSTLAGAVHQALSPINEVLGGLL